jgi:tetrahydromethanopterin S-methyltransferase subunit H
MGIVAYATIPILAPQHKANHVYKTLKIGSITLGGQPDANPALPIGSIFYDGHSIVRDAWAGDFDEKRAAMRLQSVNKAAEQCGLTTGVDIVAASEEAMEKYIEFVVPRTPLPIMINGSEAEVRIAGLRKCQELDVLDRVIYASLNEDTEPEELEALQKVRPAGVMVLAANVMNPTPEGAVEMMEETLLPMLAKIGVDVPIVDVGVMDPPSIGLSLRSVRLIKETYGFPAGGAFSNAVFTWPGLRERGRDALNATLVASAAMFRAYGGDFLHYGIVEKAAVVTQAVAACEVYLGYAAQAYDGATLSKPHPIQHMFK